MKIIVYIVLGIFALAIILWDVISDRDKEWTDEVQRRIRHHDDDTR